jgi:hypothetical protein
MFNQSQAQTQLEKFYPEATIKEWTTYLDFYLFRVEHPDLEEKNWDPFFSVDNLTGEVRDFSVLTDINSSEFSKLEWKEV